MIEAPVLGDQRQSIHTLNHEVSFATARNVDRVRPLRIGDRKQVQGFTNGFVFVAIHAIDSLPERTGLPPQWPPTERMQKSLLFAS